MNKIVRDIIDKKCSDKQKKNELDKLSEDIERAIGILSGKFQYWNTRICIWEDPINSGGNEYKDGYVDITYRICPKGHKHEVDRKERKWWIKSFKRRN